MTIEEAGQVLLEFKPYVVCERCKKNIEENRRLLNEDCPDCKSWGVVVNKRYAQACERVGMKPPQAIDTLKAIEVEAMGMRIKCGALTR